MIEISKELRKRLITELGFDDDYILKIYSHWLDGKAWMVDRHFVMNEPFENELCEMLKINFKIIDRRSGC